MENRVEENSELKWYNTTTVKMVVVAFMMLILMAPLGMIQGVINEREELSSTAQKEISEQWGGKQLVFGPMLNVPVEVRSGNNEKVVKWLHIMPDDLKVDGKMQTELRARGIYSSVLYTTKLHMSGTFDLGGVSSDGISQIYWNEMLLGVGISDLRGIRGKVNITVDSKPLTVQPGLKTQDVKMPGISAAIQGVNTDTGNKHTFTIELVLAGSEALEFVPIAQASQINVSSTWNHPSFTGAYLPQKRNINEKGFKAEWNVTYLNRDIPSQWIGAAPEVSSQTLGVDLYLPVNHYQKSMRSAKYGILFIVLTLLVFIYFEIIGKSKIHLFHYFLVGLALVLFFSILTALSEQVGFNFAYLIASVATISLITAYSHSLMRNKRNTITVTLLLLALYAFLYILLQLNEYAFLAGNIGLFVILGIIMRASLKINKNE